MNKSNKEIISKPLNKTLKLRTAPCITSNYLLLMAQNISTSLMAKIG